MWGCFILTECFCLNEIWLELKLESDLLFDLFYLIYLKFFTRVEILRPSTFVQCSDELVVCALVVRCFNWYRLKVLDSFFLFFFPSFYKF